MSRRRVEAGKPGERVTYQLRLVCDSADQHAIGTILAEHDRVWTDAAMGVMLNAEGIAQSVILRCDSCQAGPWLPSWLAISHELQKMRDSGAMTMTVRASDC